MNAKTLRIFVALSILLLGSVVVVQYYWFRQAYNLEDRDFDQRATSALRTVSKRVLEFNKNPNSQLLQPVERIKSNYYTVQVNDTINHLILEEFKARICTFRHQIKF